MVDSTMRTRGAHFSSILPGRILTARFFPPGQPEQRHLCERTIALSFPKKQVITGKIHLMEKTVFRILLPETFFANQIFFMNEIGIMHIILTTSDFIYDQRIATAGFPLPGTETRIRLETFRRSLPHSETVQT